MWGLVESGSITKLINKPKGLVIGDVRYSRKIFELWRFFLLRLKLHIKMDPKKNKITFFLENRR